MPVRFHNMPPRIVWSGILPMMFLVDFRLGRVDDSQQPWINGIHSRRFDWYARDFNGSNGFLTNCRWVSDCESSHDGLWHPQRVLRVRIGWWKSRRATVYAGGITGLQGFWNAGRICQMTSQHTLSPSFSLNHGSVENGGSGRWL